MDGLGLCVLTIHGSPIRWSTPTHVMRCDATQALRAAFFAQGREAEEEDSSDDEEEQGQQKGPAVDVASPPPAPPAGAASFSVGEGEGKDGGGVEEEELGREEAEFIKSLATSGA